MRCPDCDYDPCRCVHIPGPALDLEDAEDQAEDELVDAYVRDRDCRPARRRAPRRRRRR